MCDLECANQVLTLQLNVSSPHAELRVLYMHVASIEPRDANRMVRQSFH